MKQLFIIVVFSQPIFTYSQKYDYNFIQQNSFQNYGIMMSFNENNDQIALSVPFMDTIHIIGGITINDIDGQYLGFFNGYNIFNRDLSVAKNGEKFNQKSSFARFKIEQDYYTFSTHNRGLIVPILQDNKWVMFNSVYQLQGFDGFRLNILAHQDEGYPILTYVSEINFTIIEKTNDDKLAVDEHIKEKTLIQGFFRPDINACKHANGRDWWILVNSIISDEMYSILLNEDGDILSVDTSRLSINNTKLAGAITKTVFSANGDRMARMIIRNTFLPIILEVFDFNRCTGTAGQLYYFADTLMQPDILGALNDMVFSPNDRFLYLAIGQYLLQYEYQEPIYKIDTISTFDNTFYQDLWTYPNYFYFLWKLPNGKIAVPWPNTSNLHMILDPDRKGKACNFEHLHQIGPLYPDTDNPIFMPPIRSVPYWPDYRMPPLNKSCDPEPNEDHCFRMTPNPFRDYLILDCINTSATDQSYRVQVTNATGQLIYAQTLSDDFTSHHIQTAHWPPSMYFVTLSDQSGKSIHTYKMVKQ